VRVAVVAGPDPGHAFPAIALCRRFLAAGDAPTLLTGTEWLDTTHALGIDAFELDGLDPTEVDDDADAGAKIHQRAARMAVLNVPPLRDLAPDLVVSDVITACGGLAAELLGLPWIELSPSPLYRPSKGLPPVGSGLAPGVGLRGRLRDSVMRRLTARSWREGLRQRSAARIEIGLPAVDPGPRRRLVATLPALEVPRPDWPDEAVVVGPLHFEPTEAVLEIPPGSGPVIVVAPSTALTGARGLTELALEALRPGETLPDAGRVRRGSAPLGSDRPRPPGRAAGARRSGDLRRRTRLGVQGVVGRGTDGGGARRRRSVGDRESPCASRQCATGAAVDLRIAGGRRRRGVVDAAVP
jgi:UDP:flavonoid glycosyltransferase YjiC (YdhE family)